MSIRIIYSVENMALLLKTDRKAIKHLTKLGMIPRIEGRTPMSYDKEEIDAWIADGSLDRLRNSLTRRRKGRYGVAPK